MSGQEVGVGEVGGHELIFVVVVLAMSACSLIVLRPFHVFQHNMRKHRKVEYEAIVYRFECCKY